MVMKDFLNFIAGVQVTDLVTRVSSSWFRRCRRYHTWRYWMLVAMVSLSRVWTASHHLWNHLLPLHYRYSF